MTRGFQTRFPFKTLEELLVSEDGFGLDTATVPQRAICRIIDGQELGEYAEDSHVIEMLGGAKPEDVSGTNFTEIDIFAAVRCAKSMIAAATAIKSSQECDVSRLKRGEMPRYSIVSLSLDNAKVVLAHLLGALSQDALKGLCLDENDTAHWENLIRDVGADMVGSAFLWHPSGRPVEIRVVAGKRAGGSLVSRWSAGACFDEYPRMVGASDGVINYNDGYRAIRGRLLSGAKILSIGSPWAPRGPAYDRFNKFWGRPSGGRIVLKSSGPALFPELYTKEYCEELKIADPMAYKTDVLAEFADEQESMFPHQILQECSRETANPLPWEPGHHYIAAMDPATRGNAWTLVVADRVKRTKRIVFAKQWQGNALEPLSPKAVLMEIKEILEEYRLNHCLTDQWAADAIRDLALDMGLYTHDETWTATERSDAYLSLAAEFLEKRIEIPNDPLIHKDLKLTRKKPGQRGSVGISLTPTGDGRHCDYASALALCLKRWIDEEADLPPVKGEDGFDRWQEAQWEEREMEEFQAEQEREWWEEEILWQ